MSTININYGTNFISLDLFETDGYRHIESVVSRVPVWIGAKDQKSVVAECLKYLESLTHTKIIDSDDSERINFSENIDNVVLSGVRIPDILPYLDISEDLPANDIILDDKRLIINWGFRRIDFIYGKNHVITYSLSYENLIKDKAIQRLFKYLKIGPGEYRNFETAAPLFIGQNSYLENVFFGLVLENIAKFLRNENKLWDKDLHEIFLTGEYISTRPNSFQLLEIIGSAIGLTGVFEFYVDRYNFFNSTDVSIFKKTAEVFNYLFVPRTLRNYGHTFISQRASKRQQILLENNKIRLVNTSDVESLEVFIEKHAFKRDVEIKGNYTYIDTRDFDYAELLQILLSNRNELLKILREWERGLNEKVDYTVSRVFNMNLPRFFYSPHAEYKKNIGPDFNLHVSLDSTLDPLSQVGIYARKKNILSLDLISALDVFDEFYKYIDVIEGQNVNVGDILASKKNLLGKPAGHLSAPLAGTVRLGKMEYGFIEIEFENFNLIEPSFVKGKVAKIYPNKSIEIKASALRTRPFDIAGAAVTGQLVVNLLNKELRDKVVFVGNTDFDLVNIRKLIQIGVSGIIFDSLNFEKWEVLRDFVTGSKINLGIAVLDGFNISGRNEGLLNSLESLEGVVVSFDPAIHMLNFFVKGEEKFKMKKERKIYTKDFHGGDIVYVRDIRGWGLKAKVTNIIDDHALIRTSEEAGKVSLYNLE